MKFKAKARVRVTIDVDAESTWGDHCTIDQVYAQARSEVEGFLKTTPDLGGRVRLVRVEKIESIITGEA